MLNKLLSLLILVVTLWLVYWFYYYFFVLNKWRLTINTNTDNYIVNLYNDKLKINFATECKNPKCELIDLAPFDYTITISKEWFKEVKQNIKILSKKTINLSFNLEKQLLIKEINNVDMKETQTWNQLEKFREISSLQKSYKFFNLDTLWYFYFILNEDNTISLFNKVWSVEKKLYSFIKVSPENIDLWKVFQTDNIIFISIWEEKYIYNLLDDTIDKIFFPQSINYIKRNWKIFSFVNDKWTFLYDNETRKIEYFYLFKDFIFYDDKNYLWIIYDDEIEKKKNYNLEKKDWNLVVKYNFKTKNIEVIENIQMNVKKIILENKKVYFFDEFGKKYLVDNI